MLTQFFKRLFHILIKKDKREKIDFVGNQKKFIIGSVVAVVAAVIILLVNIFVRGDALNYGIDFKGGTQIQIEFRDMEGIDIGAVRSAIKGLAYKRVSVIEVAGAVGAKDRNEYIIRMETESSLPAAAVKKLRKQLQKRFRNADTGKTKLFRFRVSTSGDTVTLQFHDAVDEKKLRAVFAEVDKVTIANTEDAITRPGKAEQHKWRISLQGIGTRIRRELNDQLKKEVPRTGKDQFVEYGQQKEFTVAQLDQALQTAGYKKDDDVTVYLSVQTERILGEEQFREFIKAAQLPVKTGTGGVVPMGDPAEKRWRLAMTGKASQMTQNLVDRLRKAKVAKVRSFRVNAFGAVKAVKSVVAVGGKVGRRLRYDGIMSVLITLGLILVYIGLRFDLKYAPGAVMALAHDVLITAGIFGVIWLEFNLEIIAALLTIVGYSLNDTIVVFDRIRENVGRLRDRAFPKVVNTSINETLSRTVLTSVTTLLVVVVILVLARGVIWDFALALAIGILVGTYSSVFIASPTVMWLHQRFETREGRAKGKSKSSGKSGRGGKGGKGGKGSKKSERRKAEATT
jgi:preprotein translocase SecF subunit